MARSRRLGWPLIIGSVAMLLAATLAATAQQKGRSYIVLLREKADLGPVYNDRAAVKQALMATARRTQAPLLEQLDAWQEQGQVQQYQPLWITNAIVVQATPEVIGALRQDARVSAVLEDKTIPFPPVKISPTRARFQQQAAWGVEKIRAPEVWAAFGTMGEGAVCGILDSGIDGAHPDLRDRIRPINGWIDLADGLPTPYDNYGHGTFVAGHIAGGNASGPYIGVAPGTTLIVGRLGDAPLVSSIFRGMQWMMDPDGDPATDDGADVVNNSYGGGSDSPNMDRAFADAINAWRAARIFPAYAIGNSGPLPRSTGSPGDYPMAFGVGATNIADDIAYFSSRGPVFWPGVGDIIKPEISAPGEGVYSTMVGGGYGTSDGTSFACPHLVGVVGLMVSAAGGSGALTVGQIEQALKDTALDLGSRGPDNDYGWGRVDAFEAVSRVAFFRDVGVTINNDDLRTSSAQVTLDLVATTYSGVAPSGYRVANSLAGLQTTAWVSPFSNQISWTLATPDSEGSRTVYYQARVEVAPGIFIRSAIVSDDIYLDLPPKVLQATSLNDTQVDILLDQDLEPSSVEDPDNYSFTPSSAVSSARLDAVNKKLVHLTTSSQDLGVEYTVTVTGVTDRLVLTDPSGIPQVFNTEVDPNANSATYRARWLQVQSGWPQFLNSTVFGPLVSAFAGQGDWLAVVSSDGGVYVWNGNTALLRSGWPQFSGTGTVSGVAMGDVSGDGAPDVVVPGGDGSVYAWDLNGNVLPGWPQNVKGKANAAPTLADLDGDGALEVIVPLLNGEVHAWNGNGTPVPGWPVNVGASVSASVSVADLDLDLAASPERRAEVVIAGGDGRLHVLHGDGTAAAGWPVNTGGRLEGVRPAVANLDGDPQLEVVIGNQNGSLYALNHDGSNLTGWPVRPTGVRAFSSAVVEDLDGDGASEVVVGTDITSVYAFRTNGALMAGWPQQVTGATLQGSPLVADIRWDSGPEVLVSTSDGRLHAWNGRTARPVYGWPVQLNRPGAAQIMVADLDGNDSGRLELIAATGSEVWVYDVGPGTYIPAQPLWPMVGENPRRTGVKDDVPLPADTVAPRLLQVTPLNSESVRLDFSEPVSPASASETTHYVVRAGATSLKVQAAQLASSGLFVTLTTSSQTPGAGYEVVVSGVRDLAGNPIGAQNTGRFIGVDTLPPVLVTVRALAATRVEVVFNEGMDRETVENIGHYRIEPSLSIQQAALQSDGKTVHLTTGIQRGGATYQIMVVNVKDVAGNLLSQSVSLPFTGIESVPPQVVRATPVAVLGQGTVDVLFSEAVDAGTARNVTNYTFSPALAVQQAVLQPDGKTVRLVTQPQQAGMAYTVAVQNVKDLQGNVISGNNTAEFVGIDTIAPTLASVQPLDDLRVRVAFSEAVSGSTAEVESRYTIFLTADPNQVVNVQSATLQADGRTVVLVTAGQLEGAAYTLRVQGVEDLGGNAIVPGSGDTLGFTALSGAPVVVVVRRVGETGVEVEFSEAVSPITAEDVANYQIVHRDSPAQKLAVLTAVLQANGKTVRLTTAAQQEGVTYIVTVRNVQDLSGNAIVPGSGDTGMFEAVAKPPQVVGVVLISETAVELKFTEAVDEGSAEGPSNYLFEPPAEVRGVELLPAGDTVRISTSLLAESTTYTIRVRNVLDLNDQPIQTGVGDTGSFVTASVPPRLVGAVPLDSRRVRLTFDEPLAPASVAGAAYVFDPPLQVEQSQLETGGVSVVLYTREQREDITYTVAVTGVRDLAGNAIAGQNSASFATPRILPQPPSGVAVTPVQTNLRVSWIASTEADVVGYHVLRSTSLTGTYERVNLEPVTATSFTDTAVTPGVTYYYRVAALDNGPAPNQGDPSTPVSGLLPDRTPPVIQHTPLIGLAVGASALVEARVTDNGQLQSVELLYRPVGASAFERTAMTPGGNDLYQATVPASAIGSQGLEYLIQARDASGNLSSAPSPTAGYRAELFAALAGQVVNFQGLGVAGLTVQLRADGQVKGVATSNASGEFSFERVVPGAYQVAVEGDSVLPAFQTLTLRPGEQRVGFQMQVLIQPSLTGPRHFLAFPALFGNPLPSAVFGDPQVRLALFDTIANRYRVTPEIQFSIQRGRGYWLTGEGPFRIRSEAQIPDHSQAVAISVAAGWNALGNPFLRPIRLSDVRVKLPGQSDAQALSLQEAARQGWVGNFAWVYDADQGYLPVIQLEAFGLQGVLGVWQAWWLRAYREAVVMLQPPGPSYLAPSSREGVRVDSRQGWKVLLTARAGRWSDQLNWAGWLNATDRDGLRLPEPPQPSPFVNLAFVGPDGERHAVDLRASRAPRMTWDLIAETDLPNEEVVITAPDLSSLPASAAVYLEDLETGARRYLRTTPVYTFLSGPEGARRRLRLVVEENGRGSLSIRDLRIEPSRGANHPIRFELTGTATVTVELRGLNGRRLKTISAQQPLTKGRQQLVWDGRDEAGRPLAAGVYLVTVTATGEMGNTVQAVRIFRR